MIALFPSSPGKLAGLTIAAATLLPFAPASFGAAYVGAAYEGFDYVAGTVVDAAVNGGTGFNSTGDSSLANTTAWGSNLPGGTGQTRTITAGSLDYTATGYAPETGNKISVNTVTTSSGTGRNFAQTVDTGTFYFSFLVQKSSASNRSVTFSLYTGTTEAMSFGQVGGTSGPQSLGNFALGVGIGTAATLVPADTPVAFVASTVNLVIGKIVFNPVGNDTISFYVNPTDVTSEPVTPYLSTANFDLTTGVSGFRVFAGGTQTGFVTQQGDFDEIRFGTTFDSVVTTTAVPEPGVTAMLALGFLGVGFIAWRRRRLTLAA